jgi:hypothetical protein
MIKLQHKELYEENMQNIKACINLLYTFVTDWDNLTSATWVDTVILTSAVTTSSFSRISQLYKQSHLKAAYCSNECESALKMMSFTHSDLKKEWNSDLDYNKLLLNWMWTCQTTMSVCILILKQSAWRVDFKSGHILNVTCIKSNEVLNHMIIEKLINQLQHMYNDSESKKKSDSYFKSFKTERKNHSLNIWSPLNKCC